MNIKALQKGYYYQIQLEYGNGNTLYLRPNKEYEIGNSPQYSIEMGNDYIGKIICEKKVQTYIQQNQFSIHKIQVNNREINDKICELNHLDLFTIENIEFRFYSYFDADINVTCSTFHQFLLSKYPQLHRELSLIQRNSFNSFKSYKYALTSLWKSIENDSFEKQKVCEEMFEFILSIVMNDNPLDKFKRIQTFN